MQLGRCIECSRTVFFPFVARKRGLYMRVKDDPNSVLCPPCGWADAMMSLWEQINEEPNDQKSSEWQEWTNAWIHAQLLLMDSEEYESRAATYDTEREKAIRRNAIETLRGLQPSD